LNRQLNKANFQPYLKWNFKIITTLETKEGIKDEQMKIVVDQSVFREGEFVAKKRFSLSLIHIDQDCHFVLIAYRIRFMQHNKPEYYSADRFSVHAGPESLRRNCILMGTSKTANYCQFWI